MVWTVYGEGQEPDEWLNKTILKINREAMRGAWVKQKAEMCRSMLDGPPPTRLQTLISSSKGLQRRICRWLRIPLRNRKRWC